MQRITLIGGGNMACALAAGLRKAEPALEINVVEPHPEQAARIAPLCRQVVAQSERALIEGADAVILAVKPQVLPEACAQLKPHLNGELIISIAAGTPIARIAQWLGGHNRIVRTMPNTPALVGQAMTGLFAPSHLDAADVAIATRLLEACGRVLRVDDEARLDAVTAVSGSGPAYVFHWLESMLAAAESVGFTPEEAHELVMTTLRGSLTLAENSGESPATLRERVTSKGGTTEAALAVLAQHDVSAAYVAAVQAALRRARELASSAP
ncbi:MAG: pyrroline-5-carboxylate reductase [Casimicrobiaceae bacterium]|nr:pyrroline-5-carboxylate reductase [Casimicrobiaceae bacterium]